jgi:2-methylcitrate dehydratase PrpD
MPLPAPGTAAAEVFAHWAAGLSPAAIPEGVRHALRSSLADVAGLCLSARGTGYVAAALAAWEGAGPCTAIGHVRSMDAAGAAFVNGTAAHGEDYDDTFEGTPVHTGVVIWPAVLAACEAHGRSGADALRGAAVGVELMCRMALVAPTAQHQAGFHPTAVIGALGAAAAVGTALGHNARQITDALGVAGSMASGIIEYLAEGTWTKRMHPGWAAQAGLRAAALGRAGFAGPRTVLDGENGFFSAFGSAAVTPNVAEITAGLGTRWHASTIAFKPYACGTMCQPYIDCAIRLARAGLRTEDVADIECKVGEGTVHRLWEPAGEKRSPSSAYSAKFSVPFCIAVALTDQAAGLAQFTSSRAADPRLRALAANVRYRIDPANPYPREYTGHLRVTTRDGRVLEAEQPHLRGGRHEPLPPEELQAKFHANARFGGVAEARGFALLRACLDLFGAPAPVSLSALRG